MLGITFMPRGKLKKNQVKAGVFMNKPMPQRKLENNQEKAGVLRITPTSHESLIKNKLCGEPNWEGKAKF